MYSVDKAKQDYVDTISAGNWAFAQCCFEVAIRQAKEAAERNQKMGNCGNCGGQGNVWLPCQTCRGKNPKCSVCVGMGQVYVRCAVCRGSGKS